MYENYNHNITVNATEILCNNDESVGIYDLQFVGSSAENALEVFVNDLNNSSNGIDLTICRLRLCHQNCEESNVSNENRATEKSQNNEHDLTLIILLIMVIILAIVSVSLCFVVCCLRYRYRYIYVSLKCCICTSNSMHNNFTMHVCMYY